MDITGQRASGSFYLRYEDVAQDGRVRPDPLTSALGVVWRAILLPDALKSELRDEGIIPILTTLEAESFEGTFAIEAPLDVDGGYVLSHARAPDGSVDKIFLDMEVDVHGPLGRTNLPPPDKKGERALVGRVRAEHVFTRPFALPGERKVTSLPIDGERYVPGEARAWRSPLSLLELPPGAKPLDEAPVDDGVSLALGLGHTDSNQHVNSLVYPRLFEEAALRRFARAGLSTAILPRRFVIGYRRPSFAGDSLRVSLRAFEVASDAGVQRGCAGAFFGAGDDPTKPRACIQMIFA